MNELTDLIEIDRLIAQKKTELDSAQAKLALCSIELGIEVTKEKIKALELKQDEIAIAGAAILGEVKTIAFDGVEFTIKKGRRSVKMSEGVDLTKLPPKFVTTTLAPNKNKILAAKQDELEAIAEFAAVVVGADRLTYKVL